MMKQTRSFLTLLCMLIIPVMSAFASEASITVFEETQSGWLQPTEEIPSNTSYLVLETATPDSGRFTQAWAAQNTLHLIRYFSPRTAQERTGWIPARQLAGVILFQPHEDVPQIRLEISTLVYDSATDESKNEIAAYWADQPEKPFQQLTYPTLVALDSPEYVQLIDMNFDGYKDIETVYSIGNANRYCRYFLWNAQTSLFESESSLDMLSNYTLVPETKEIYNYTHDSALAGGYARYAWENGVLVEKASATRTMEGANAREYAKDASGGVLLDETYSLDWYEQHFEERDEALRQLVYGAPAQ